jgi:predicted CopG family antitoxin
MASKTIIVQEETYQMLLRLKKENESFNDVILRLVYRHQDLTPYCGLLADMAGELDAALTEGRIANDLADQERVG